MTGVQEALERLFGHSSFRAGQQEVVNAVLGGSDVLAVMPTGSGKSLGYQLPAVLLPGITLVVSPLIALMKDQVDELNRKGIRAGALHSLLSADERRDTLRAARAGELRLLYVAPERFSSENFYRLLPELSISRFAVDEAHCVSDWGHDFRPDYLRLKEAAERCRPPTGSTTRPPLVAFTATATPEVRDEIVRLLGLVSPRIFVAGFDRPNLVLAVRKVSGETEKRKILPSLVKGRRALVYASTRKSTERAAQALVDAGIRAASYHAGLEDQERGRVQDAFADGSLAVVCATNAFGMGIDRPDVEAVIHFEIPGSLEAYYQEIGRGGRDGRTADAILLWNYVDVRTREFFIDKEDDDNPARPGNVPSSPAQREHKRQLDRLKLRRMVAYADSSGCLRATLLRYFGEPGVREFCGTCGACQSRRMLDAEQLLVLRKVLSGVARGGERWGRKKIAAMLAGRTEELPPSLTSLSTTGILSGLGTAAAESWLEAATGAGLLAASDDVYRTLSLTPRGRDVMAGRTTEIFLALPEKKSAIKPKRGRKERPVQTLPAPAPTAEAPPDEAVLALLKEWRRTEAARRQVPGYVVFHDKTLQALASLRPATLPALAEIPGLGPAKLALYAASLLALFASAKNRGGAGQKGKDPAT